MKSKALLGVGVIALMAGVGSAAPAQANPDTKVEIVGPDYRLNSADETAKEIQGMTFPQGVNVGVLISNDSSLSKDDYDATVKKYAMRHLPSTLVNKSANDLQPKALLITISPEIHKMGAYGGKETGINSTWVQSAIDAMRPYAENSDWNSMAVEGAQSVADSAMANVSAPGAYEENPPITDVEGNPWGVEDDSSTQSLLDKARNILMGIGGAILAVTLALFGVNLVLRKRREREEKEQRKAKEAEDVRRREEELKAMDAWSGPGAEWTEMCLGKWDEAEKQYSDLSIPWPSMYSNYQEALRKHRDSGYELPLEQRRDIHVVNDLHRATEGGENCTADALENLYQEKIERAFYTRELDNWEEKWSKAYSKATDDEFRALRENVSTAKNHLSSGDHDALNALYENSLEKARSINDDVLYRGADIKAALHSLESLRVSTRDELGRISARIIPRTSPRGMSPRRGSNHYNASLLDSYNIMGLLWGSQAISNSHSHSNFSSHSSFSSGSSFDSGSSSSGGGFDGGSGGW